MPRAPALSGAAAALRESIFARLAGRLASHPDPVPLHLGDTYLAPPDGALLLDPRSSLKYGPPAGEPRLVERLLAKLASQNGLTLTAAQLQITCGATQALAAAARAVLDPGDEVIVPSPHWPLINGILTNAGARPVECDLSQQLYADPTLDAATLLRPYINDRTAAIYVTTPNNPDGKVLTRAQLESIAELARAHDLWVLADEVYEDLVYEGEHVSIATLPGMAERTLTSFSLSKSLALAGYRLGYLVGPEPAMRAARKIVNHTVYNVPDLLQVAAARLVGSEEERRWRAQSRATYLEARRRVAARLSARAFLPEAGTYFLLDLREAVKRRGEGSLWPLVEQLLGEGVSISPGEQFGLAFSSHARLCFSAVPIDRVEIGLERIARALE
jgi:aspartate/methionine/tyrosine aminotransferase